MFIACITQNPSLSTLLSHFQPTQVLVPSHWYHTGKNLQCQACSTQWTLLHHNKGSKFGGTELRNGAHDVFHDTRNKPKYLFYFWKYQEIKEVNLNYGLKFFIVAPCILKSITVHSPTNALFIKLGFGLKFTLVFT
jgi:hypothetical protein